MVKSNAQKQKDYRERKKLEDSAFLQKERKRQKVYYVKTSNLSRKELTSRRIAVKERVQRSRDRKKALLLEQMTSESSYASSTTTDVNTDGTMSPMVVSIPFPKKGEASRKRKRRSDDRLYKKITKLEKERKKLKTKCESLQKKISRSSRRKENAISTPNTKTNKMLRTAEINSVNAPEIRKQLLFAETLSSEIREAGKERKNRKTGIRSMISGKILRK